MIEGRSWSNYWNGAIFESTNLVLAFGLSESYQRCIGGEDACTGTALRTQANAQLEMYRNEEGEEQTTVQAHTGGRVVPAETTDELREGTRGHQDSGGSPAP